MIWLTVLLAALLGATSAAARDGQPPVTIIEIPLATTSTTGTTSSAVTPENSILTTSPAPATSSSQIEDEVLPTVTRPFRWWVALVALAVGGLIAVALIRLRRSGLPDERTGWVVSEPGLPSAASPLGLERYEAVVYRTVSRSSEVQQRTLGEFTTLEAAIDAARLDRTWFALNSPFEAFWVVWNLHLKRAVWIAESSTPGENVIDLRTGRRKPYPVESPKA